MQTKSLAWAGFAAASLLAPVGALAQFTATAFQNFNVQGPNSLNFATGPSVVVGAFGPNGISGTATRSGAEVCAGPLSLTLPNLGGLNVPTLAQGGYSVPSVASICAESWLLTLNVGALKATALTPTLTGAPLVPFVSNNSVTSSSDGKVHTFGWSGVPGVDSLRINVFDRTQMATGGQAQLLRSQNFVGTTTSFVIDLNEPGTPFANDRPYTLEVSLIDTRDNNLAVPNNINILSRSRTYFDFTLPLVPLTTAPVFLPIVEHGPNGPTYTFTVTVDATGTFVIDPDIAIGYIYQTAPGNPNFRSVSLPNVGDRRFLVEIFDPSASHYRKDFTALAGRTYSFTAHGYPHGVSKFRVKGIEIAAGLDAANPSAFPTALGFTGAGTFTGSMVPITKYAFSGFLPPINLPPTVNTSSTGRSFPFKWTLADVQGYAVTDLGAVDSITYKASACAPFATDPTGALPAGAAGRSKLRYDTRGNQYVFDWKSPKQPGCYVLFLKLDSGQVFNANVMLTKGRDDD